jgi:hypothetical protein
VSKDVQLLPLGHRDEFPGVEVVPASVREYPNGTMAAHVLGWVGQIDAQEIKDKKFKNYGPNDLVGKTGLEQQYERFLRGRKGQQKYLVDSNQQIVRLLGEQPAVPGDDLVLSLDINTQRIAEQALSDGIANTRAIFDDTQSPPAYLKANSGAVIVMDPTTGEIKALASWPTFDPSWFVQSLTKKRIAALFATPGRRRSVAPRGSFAPDAFGRSSRWPPSRTASRTSAAITHPVRVPRGHTDLCNWTPRTSARYRRACTADRATRSSPSSVPTSTIYKVDQYSTTRRCCGTACGSSASRPPPTRYAARDDWAITDPVEEAVRDRSPERVAPAGRRLAPGDDIR